MNGDPGPGRVDTTGAVVVGVDGTEGSLAALQWAVAEATAHHAPLCVVRAGCPVVVVPAPERRQDTLVPQGSPTAASAVPAPVEGVRTLYSRYRATPVRR